MDVAQGNPVIAGSISNMLQRLEASIHDLEICLDEATEPSKRVLPHNPSPEAILAYAHLIRHTTFARTSASLPPAPQPWQMAQSSLTRIARDHGTNQRLLVQQQQQRGITQHLQPLLAEQQALATASGQRHLGEKDVAVDTRRQEQQVPPPAPAAAPKPVNPSAFDFILNADMEEVDDASSSSSSTSSEEDEDGF